VERLVWDRIISTDVVEAGHFGFAAQLVDELALPKKHNMLLILRSLLHFGCKHFASLLFFYFEDFSESATSEFLHNLEAAIEDLLPFLQVRHFSLFITINSNDNYKITFHN